MNIKHQIIQWFTKQLGLLVLLWGSAWAQDVITVQPSLLPPQARFATAKTVYASGELVQWVDYSYDPSGAGIKRIWTNRQDRYYQAGEQQVQLQVVNTAGQTSAPYTRTITITEEERETPLSVALRYGALGSSFPDDTLRYPNLTPKIQDDRYILVFSDSPETVNRAGVLYRATAKNRVRVYANHLNNMGQTARLQIWVSRAVSVQVLQQGEGGPSRFPEVAGQVALLDYLAQDPSTKLFSRSYVQTGIWQPVYTSPPIAAGQTVNLIWDARITAAPAPIAADQFAQIAIVMQPEGVGFPPNELPLLPRDNSHVRGTFSGQVRKLQVNLDQLPAKLVLGDNKNDLALQGIDQTDQSPVVLQGNYGLIYDLNITNANRAAVALSARGGLFKGAMRIDSPTETHLLRIPENGAIISNNPVLLHRSSTSDLRMQLTPAGGSFLPIHLTFYSLDSLNQPPTTVVTPNPNPNPNPNTPTPDSAPIPVTPDLTTPSTTPDPANVGILTD